MTPKLIYLGGAETVTGSKFLLESENHRLLVDCGLFQGYKWLRERNRQTVPLDVSTLDAVVLTHAHLDHSGYLPVLYRHGYRGPVYCHQATADLCRILLADSAYLQEEDARYFSRHQLSRHEHPEPLYNRQDAEACMALFKPIAFGQAVDLGDLKFHLQPVGHILGAASVIAETHGRRIGFSGDVGRSDDIFMPPPQALPALDILLLESTYGNRRHHDVDPFVQLAEIVNRTAARGGVVLMPSFAVGRAQMLQYMLAELIGRGAIPRLPIYLDSPMAIEVSELYASYADLHKLSAEQYQRIGEVVSCTRQVEESQALAELRYPHIIIAGSGMATGGRILHHFKRHLGNSNNTVVFPGFQAGGTRGDKMCNGAEVVKIHGEWFPVKAHIESLHGLSGHADYRQIGEWLAASGVNKRTAIKLVHGEPEALEAQREYLARQHGLRAEVAGYRSILHV